MVDFVVHSMGWCIEHGHPILMLQADGIETAFWVSLAPEDAQAMTTLPGSASAPSARAYSLLETLLNILDVQLNEVRFTFNAHGVLQAELHLAGPAGITTVPAYGIDGVILAWRRGCPLRMTDRDLDRLRRLPHHPPAQHQTTGDDTNHQQVPPDPFRRYIDSLNLEQLDDSTDD